MDARIDPEFFRLLPFVVYSNTKKSGVRNEELDWEFPPLVLPMVLQSFIFFEMVARECPHQGGAGFTSGENSSRRQSLSVDSIVVFRVGSPRFCFLWRSETL